MAYRLLALLFLTAAACEAAPEDGRLEGAAPPNIVYILADDLGYGELGSYGQTKIQTPHLDRLAAEGMRFTQHYSGSPVCAPSRATLLTGLHTGHAYVRDNYELGGFADDEERGQLPLKPGTFTLGRMLQDAGYVTAAIGKWGLGGPGSTGLPTEQGFDLFYGYLDQKQAHNYYPTHLWRGDAEGVRWDTLRNAYFAPHQQLETAPRDEAAYDAYQGTDYAPDLMTAEALRFIRAHQDTSFFLYLPSIIPHLALQVPSETLGAYTFDETPYLGQDGYLPHARPRAAYAAMISRLDDHVGQILALLDELGLARRTLVLFSSDNGPTYLGGADTEFFDSNGPLRGYKGSVYEGGIRVPLLARWPGRIAPGTTSDHVSAFWDVVPTLAGLTGAPVPDSLDGLSFLPTLLGIGPQPTHDYLYWEHHNRHGGQQAARMGDWKGVRVGIRDDPSTPVELYDLAADLGETRDVAAEHPEIAQRIRALMDQRAPSEINRWNFSATN